MSNYVLGEHIGTETTTLTVNQMPGHGHDSTHNHNLEAVNDNGNETTPVGNLLAKDPSGNVYLYHTGQGETVPMESDAVAPDTTTSASTGGSGSHANLQPLLAVNFIICWHGDFPLRP